MNAKLPPVAVLVCCGLGLLTATHAVLHARQPAMLTSAWRADEDIIVDGNDAEWHEVAGAVPGTPLLVSAANDAGWLHLRVRVPERSGQIQVLYGGLTVWFDARGGQRKTFGIRYPVGAPLPAPRARESRPRRPVEDPGHVGGGDSPPGDSGHPLGQGPGRRGRGAPVIDLDPVTVVPPRLEVRGPGDDDARSLVLEHATGLRVALARHDTVLVYELRVPLRRSAGTPYAVDAAPGTTLGLGFESPKLEWPRPEAGRPGGLGRPGSGPGGWPGPVDPQRPRGGVGGQRPSTPDRPEPVRHFRAWVRLSLARMPSSS